MSFQPKNILVWSKTKQVETHCTTGTLGQDCQVQWLSDVHSKVVVFKVATRKDNDDKNFGLMRLPAAARRLKLYEFICWRVSKPLSKGCLKHLCCYIVLIILHCHCSGRKGEQLCWEAATASQYKKTFSCCTLASVRASVRLKISYIF